ncbi:DEAD/DEAH box helicase family protein [Cupriavidus necator]|uniref:DEAD/DEAH box helicase family protein n=1 Tax=Cupriavidus necator TaxID=106590 RepID=UPI001F29FC31|nr:DEAD/DEAH box helicase family protein [Cupriavidus necator]
MTEHKDGRGKKAYTPSLLFPRYHQWDVVGKLLDATLGEGVGQTYLVQHSAGSGKSNTIGWLAHRLASLHNDKDGKVFSSVIVITDRRVLDQQLQDTIYQFDHQQGVVEKIDENSSQLAKALDKGKLIIITTLQKFPWVLDKVGSLGGKSFALIIDEAHSSQSGKAAVKLREVLTKDEGDGAIGGSGADDESELTDEDVLNSIMASRKRPPNVSYYAFTATPKPKTMELFGRNGADGTPEPFHVYSMRQAIEERFILDVLRGYPRYAATIWDLAARCIALSMTGKEELPIRPPPPRVPVHHSGALAYVLLSEIPEPARSFFTSNIQNSTRPAVGRETDPKDCAYLWDWEDFLDGRR